MRCTLCGAARCYDHYERCGRCGWLRARAMLRAVYRYTPRRLAWYQCVDRCEGRPAAS